MKCFKAPIATLPETLKQGSGVRSSSSVPMELQALLVTFPIVVDKQLKKMEEDADAWSKFATMFRNMYMAKGGTGPFRRNKNEKDTLMPFDTFLTIEEMLGDVYNIAEYGLMSYWKDDSKYISFLNDMPEQELDMPLATGHILVGPTTPGSGMAGSTSDGTSLTSALKPIDLQHTRTIFPNLPTDKLTDLEMVMALQYTTMGLRNNLETNTTEQVSNLSKQSHDTKVKRDSVKVMASKAATYIEKTKRAQYFLRCIEAITLQRVAKKTTRRQSIKMVFCALYALFEFKDCMKDEDIPNEKLDAWLIYALSACRKFLQAKLAKDVLTNEKRKKYLYSKFLTLYGKPDTTESMQDVDEVRILFEEDNDEPLKKYINFVDAEPQIPNNEDDSQASFDSNEHPSEHEKQDSDDGDDHNDEDQSLGPSRKKSKTEKHMDDSSSLTT